MAGPHLRRWARLGAALAALLGPARTFAAPPVTPAAAPSVTSATAPSATAAVTHRPLILLPTVLADGVTLRRPRAADAFVVPLARSLDTLLTDTAQDLGLTVDLTQRSPPSPAQLEDAELLGQARSLGSALVLPSLRLLPSGSGEVELRLVLADPSARSLQVRSERVSREEIPVRAVIMLRDLSVDLGAPGRAAAPVVPAAPAAPSAPARSWAAPPS